MFIKLKYMTSLHHNYFRKRKVEWGYYKWGGNSSCLCRQPSGGGPVQWSREKEAPIEAHKVGWGSQQWAHFASLFPWGCWENRCGMTRASARVLLGNRATGILALHLLWKSIWEVLWDGSPSWYETPSSEWSGSRKIPVTGVIGLEYFLGTFSLTKKGSIFVFFPGGLHEELGYGKFGGIRNSVLVVYNYFSVLSNSNLI